VELAHRAWDAAVLHLDTLPTSRTAPLASGRVTGPPPPGGPAFAQQSLTDAHCLAGRLRDPSVAAPTPRLSDNSLAGRYFAHLARRSGRHVAAREGFEPEKGHLANLLMAWRFWR
jgi:hypothetical protein